MIGAYLRVSTEDQAERGTIELQREEIARWAARESVEVRWYEDAGWSGTLALEDRPAAGAMLRALTAGELAGVIVWKLDRLDRDPVIRLPFIRMLESRGLTLRSVTESIDITTPLGEFTTTIAAAQARMERRVFIERSRAGTRRVAQLAGRWLGGIVPYGYRKRADMTLEVDETPIPGLEVSEAEVVRMIFRWCADDGWGCERIAHELDARGIPTSYALDGREILAGETHGTRAPSAGKRKRATAGKWPHSRVLAILHNELYRGVHRYGKRTKAAVHDLIEREMPAIVSPALWERAQRRIAENIRWKRTHPKRLYVLRGLLTCECRRSLIGTRYTTKTGDVLMYRCEAHSEGKPPRVMEAAAEPLLWADVVRFFEHPDEVVRAIARGRAGSATVEAKADEELLAIAAETRDVDDQERRLLDGALQGFFRPEILAEKRDALRGKREALERRAAHVREVRQRAAAAAGETAAAKKLLAKIAERARNASPAVRAEVLRALVKSTRVSWEGKRTKLEVVYAFGRGHDFGRIPARMPMRGVAATGVDEWSLEHVIERVHVLPETGRWLRKEVPLA